MAQQIAKQTGYIELAAIPNFNRKFAEADIFMIQRHSVDRHSQLL